MCVHNYFVFLPLNLYNKEERIIKSVRNSYRELKIKKNWKKKQTSLMLFTFHEMTVVHWSRAIYSKVKCLWPLKNNKTPVVYLAKANKLPVAYNMANFLAFNRSTGKYKADNENIKQLIDTQTIKPIILCVLLCEMKTTTEWKPIGRHDVAGTSPETGGWSKSFGSSPTGFPSARPTRCWGAFWTRSARARARRWVCSSGLCWDTRRVPVSGWPSSANSHRGPRRRIITSPAPGVRGRFTRAACLSGRRVD